jgi:anion-transporting  ArsA/GET3 family ATPase
VLCLTIDPARRLAEALGIERCRARQVVDPAELSRARRPADRVAHRDDARHQAHVRRARREALVDAREGASKLLDNKLYQYVSTSLAGTQEYMAMEKLVAVRRDPRFDLIILDTPPTANALDFLDAPERLIDALDSATMRWFVQAFQSTGKLSLNLLARSAAIVLRGLGRITGAASSRRWPSSSPS